MAYFAASALSDLIHSTKLEPKTSIELLRICKTKPQGTVIPELHATFGDEILSYVTTGSQRPQLVGCQNEALARSHSGATCLQILFLSSIRKDGCTTNRLEVTANTLKNLCTKLSVPLAFIDAVLNPSIWSKQSGALFHQNDSHGQVESLSGFYHYFNVWDLGPLHVFFTYNLSNLITYILIDCPTMVRSTITSTIILNNTYQSNHFLIRPLAIDFLIAEQCSLWREEFINGHYQRIFDWHDRNGSMNPPLKSHISSVENIQTLHQLSRTWNMIYEDLGDLSERLDFLLSTSHKLRDAGLPDTRSAVESFEFIKARNTLRRRWVTSFSERTKLIINFVFSIASQNHGETNLEIASLTSTIAEETQKDNSSMITIATMTMLFLPGTFVSAIFSMVFFNYGLDSDGHESFQVSTRLWIFFAVTVPLTVLVSGIYQYWRRRREWRMKVNRMQKDAERGQE